MALQDLNYNGSTNRVMDAMTEYAEHNAKYAIDNSIILKKDRSAIELQRNFYIQLRKGYRRKKGLNKEEKASLKYARREIRLLRVKLDPWYSPLLLIRLLQVIIDALDPKYATIVLHRQTIDNIQKDQARTHNAENLQLQLKKTGFNVSMQGPLEKALRHDLPEFHLRYSDPRLKNTEYILHFKKIPKTNTYYFERFDASPQRTLQDAISKSGKSQSISFSVLDDNQFSPQLAASLVNGKSVQKTVNGESKWYAFDYTRNLPGERLALRTFDLDLDTSISKLPIKELSNSAQKNKILDALKRGDRQEVNIKLPNGYQRFSIEINANSNKLLAYDQSGRLSDLDALLKGEGTRMNKKLMTKALNPKTAPTLQKLSHSRRA